MNEKLIEMIKQVGGIPITFRCKHYKDEICPCEQDNSIECRESSNREVHEFKFTQEQVIKFAELLQATTPTLPDSVIATIEPTDEELTLMLKPIAETIAKNCDSIPQLIMPYLFLGIKDLLKEVNQNGLLSIRYLKIT